MRGLQDKVAIVTGGASGIGLAVSQRLAEEGCTVGIFDLNGDGAESAAKTLAGGRGMARHCDITDYKAVEKAVASFEAEAGPTDILVNNAGWDQLRNFIDSDVAFWNKVVDINLYGPLNMHHVVLKGMVDRESGVVVNISSDAGRVGSSGESVYSACKGGLIAFSKTLARELTRKKIRINTVCPGPTDTPLFAAVSVDKEVGEKIRHGLQRAIPMRRLGQPEDYAGMVAFLASDDAGYITGQTISVSGGLTMHG